MATGHFSFLAAEWPGLYDPSRRAERNGAHRSAGRLLLRAPLYTNFEDTPGSEVEVALSGAGMGADYEKFKAKAQAFLREHTDHIAIAKLRTNRSLTANQIQFVNLVVDHLTRQGAMKPERLYESPFTDVAPQRPDGLFASAQVGALFDVLHAITRSASAA